jgi:hypothetical protein
MFYDSGITYDSGAHYDEVAAPKKTKHMAKPKLELDNKNYEQSASLRTPIKRR